MEEISNNMGIDDNHVTAGTVDDGILMTIFIYVCSFTATAVYYAVVLVLILKAIQLLIESVVAARQLYSTDFQQYGDTIALFCTLLFIIAFIIVVVSIAVVCLLLFLFGCVLAVGGALGKLLGIAWLTELPQKFAGMCNALTQAEKERRAMESLRTGQRERFWRAAMDVAQHHLQQNPELFTQQIEEMEPIFRQLRTMDAEARNQW